MTGDELAAKLAAARYELADAHRQCRLLGHAAADPHCPADLAARLDVEVAVAARRLELWQGVVEKLEAAAGCPVHMFGHCDAPGGCCCGAR